MASKHNLTNNKKARFDVTEFWPEYLMIFFLIIGLILSITIKSRMVNYFVIVLAGFITGRLFYEIRKRTAIPYYLIVAGFLIGYLLGSYFYSSIKLIVLLFVLANVSAYYAYSKGII